MSDDPAVLVEVAAPLAQLGDAIGDLGEEQSEVVVRDGVKDRDFFTLAAADYFFTRPLMALFMAITVNALPVARGKGGGGHQSLATIRRRLIEERIGLILYPEGTRSRSGEMSRFRAGIGTLVAGTDIPVVPCYIEGAHAAWPAGVKLPRPKKIRVIVGKPLSFANVSPEPHGCRDVAAQLEAAVQALGGGTNNDVMLKREA